MSITKQELAQQLQYAEARANRAMREASALIEDQGAWDAWQAAEQRASEARKRWLEAEEEQQAA